MIGICEEGWDKRVTQESVRGGVEGGQSGGLC